MEEKNGRRASRRPRLCQRETPDGQIAQAVLTARPGKWTQRDFEQLTRWQLGLPATVQFQIMAGPVGAHAPKRVDVSPERRTLLRRKYGTFAERQAARKAKEAARQASLRLKKMA
jgi:hypothetical protein